MSSVRKTFEPGRGYTQEDWDDADIPPITPEQLAQARPFAEVFPELAEKMRKKLGRPPLEEPKKPVSIRLDADVVAKFKATGPGWQSRINDVLKKAKVG